MGLEVSFENIGDLNPDWPLDTDPFAEGAPHLRGIKESLQGNVQGDGTLTGLFNGSVNKPAGFALATKANGIYARDTVATNPVVELLNSTNVVAGDVGATLTELYLRARQVGQGLTLSYTDGGGVKSALHVTPAGVVSIYNGGVEVMRTTVAGVQLMAVAPTLALWDVGGVTQYANLVAGAGLVALNSLAGEVSLQAAGVVRLQTFANGINVNGAAVNTGQILLNGNAGATQAFIEGNSGGLTLAAGTAGAILLQTGLGATLLATFDTAGLAMAARQITGMADATAPTDAVTLQQLNAAIGGLSGSLVLAGATVNAAGTVVTNQLTARTLSVVKGTVGLFNWTLAAGSAIKQVQVNAQYTGAGSIVANLGAAPGALTFQTRLSLSATQLNDQPHMVVVY